MKLEAAQNPSKRRAVLLWARLASAYNHLSRDAERNLEAHPISLMEFDILTHVGSNPNCTQAELSERLLVTQGNITYHIHKLEQHGWLERHSDGRCKRLRLTASGRDITRTAARDQEALHLEHFSKLSASEQEQLLSLLRKLS